jgi:TCP-1/cpn60 chaperonin family
MLWPLALSNLHICLATATACGLTRLFIEMVVLSCHDGCCLPGGGAVEAALSIYLESFAKTLGSREQLAIAEFADALLVIPKTLAVNAGKVGGWACCSSCTM